MGVKNLFPNFSARGGLRASWISVTVAIAAVLMLVPGVAWAHAVLVQSTPTVNATVEGPDVAVNMKFSSRIDGKRSTLLLSTSDGQSRPLTIDAQDSSDTLSAHLTRLGPGKYAIHWQVLATDGHVTRGEIPFTVK